MPLRIEQPPNVGGGRVAAKKGWIFIRCRLTQIKAKTEQLKLLAVRSKRVPLFQFINFIFFQVLVYFVQ